jgi:phospholipid/cholesterol/gamma-HCH transport system substrate-binding protein
LKITKEIKAGILVIASISLFIWGYSYLKGKDILNNYKTFFVKYDNVEGLAATASITINGLVVGQVAGIKLQPNGEILVQLQIKNDFPFSKSSVVALYEPGLIAGRQLQIIPNFKDTTIAVSGDTLTSSVKKGLTDLVSDKLAPLQQKIEKMVVNADLLLTNLNDVLDAKSKENLKNSISNLSKTIEGFNSVVDNANTILYNNKGNIDKTFSNLNKVSTDFSKISDSLSKANLTKVVHNLENTLSNVDKIMNDVQAGKGSLGKMVKDDALYNNLEKTSKELELLLQDVRLNPTRYVNVSLFGKKNKPYKSPNDSIKNVKN